MNRNSSKLFVGMDVHKESIDIAVAEEGGEVRHQGRSGGNMNALSRAVRKLESLGRSLVFVYEAGPCGFGIFRRLQGRGHECWVVAPSNTARRVRDRIKTDRHRHQGAITKAGNSSARRALVEAAWACRHAAAVSPIIARRQTGLPKAAIDIAWKSPATAVRAVSSTQCARA